MEYHLNILVDLLEHIDSYNGLVRKGGMEGSHSFFLMGISQGLRVHSLNILKIQNLGG